MTSCGPASSTAFDAVASQEVPVRQRLITPSDTSPLSSLTGRELEVLSGIVAGRSNPELADDLFVSVNTVKFHVTNVLRKLRVKSRIEAAVLAARLPPS